MSKELERKREILRRLHQSDKIDKDQYDDTLKKLEEDAAKKTEELKDQLSLMTHSEAEDLFTDFIPVRL